MMVNSTPLRTAAANASRGVRIVFLIVAHGLRINGGILVGTRHNGKQRRVSRAQIGSWLAGAPKGVEFTIITTACFSGLWAVPFTKLRN